MSTQTNPSRPAPPMGRPVKPANGSSRAESSQARSSRSRLLLIVAICLVGINLRPTLTSLGPVLDSVRSSLGMSGTSIGLLITLPILCFGVFAPAAPRLLRYRSAEYIIFFGLLVLVCGIGLRSLFGVAGLFTGTLIAGASISVVMVLLPSIIKRHFPHRAGLLMGLYSMALCLGAAVAAGATVPLQNLAGNSWRWALAFWLLPAVIAAAVWSRQLSSRLEHENRPRYDAPSLHSSALAWQVTLYMGFQSALAYCVFGWLPVILIDRGITPLLAGLVLSVSIGLQLVTSLAGPWMATRGRDQRSTIALMLSLTLIGLMGCLYGPIGSIWPWAILLGLGQGGSFSIALALLVLRAPNAQVAASLSGMAQGVGYTIAALGPLAVGFLHQYSGNWHSVAAFFVVILIAALVFGLGGGRARLIETGAAPSAPVS